LIRVTGRRGGSGPLRLLELIVRRLRRPAGSGPSAPPLLELLAVEWLLLQDPAKDVSLARPRCRARSIPALGIANDGLLVTSLEGEIVRQPERAREERSFPRGQTVNGRRVLAHRVALEKALS
jgi:hypothetical protein